MSVTLVNYVVPVVGVVVFSTLAKCLLRIKPPNMGKIEDSPKLVTTIFLALATKDYLIKKHIDSLSYYDYFNYLFS